MLLATYLCLRAESHPTTLASRCWGATGRHLYDTVSQLPKSSSLILMQWMQWITYLLTKKMLNGLIRACGQMMSRRSANPPPPLPFLLPTRCVPTEVLGTAFLMGVAIAFLAGAVAFFSCLVPPCQHTSHHCMFRTVTPFYIARPKIVSQSLHVKLTDLEEGVQAGSIATTKS